METTCQQDLILQIILDKAQSEREDPRNQWMFEDSSEIFMRLNEASHTARRMSHDVKHNDGDIIQPDDASDDVDSFDSEQYIDSFEERNLEKANDSIHKSKKMKKTYGQFTSVRKLEKVIIDFYLSRTAER